MRAVRYLAWPLGVLTACAGPVSPPAPALAPDPTPVVQNETQVPNPPSPEAPAEIVEEPAFSPGKAIALADLGWHEDFASVRSAEDLLDLGRLEQAVEALADVESPAAAVIRARIFVAQENWEEAAGALGPATEDEALVELVALERGLITLGRGQHAEAVPLLEPFIERSDHLAPLVVEPLSEALVVADPARLVSRFDALAAVLPDEVAARSKLLDAKARALVALGRTEEAQAVAVQRFLEEPVPPETPTTPPAGVTLSATQLLRRAEVLLEAHRNDRVIEAMAAIDESALSETEKCRLLFGRGLAHRKLHHYSSAEKDLTLVHETCADQDLARRAMYLAAKVISIKSGLRAIAPIEAFAKRFAGHSMVDDVLFWAGDLYQRRGRNKEAAGYYSRIAELPTKGDYCADARWRLAWMAYRQKDLALAGARLSAAAEAEGCASNFDRARAHYWLGRTAEQQKNAAASAAAYAQAIDDSPLGFYGQLALKRLLAADPEARPAWKKKLAAPAGEGVPALCPGYLAGEEKFGQAVELLIRGLGADAAAQLMAIAKPEQAVVAKDHAASQGVAVETSNRHQAPLAEGCGKGDPDLLIALLLVRAGAHRDGHWRLRTEFAEVLERLPGPAEIGIFRAAYPLAYRSALQAAEQEQNIPSLFLQALSREESAFDPEVVSWAGAYGLTQLLLRTGQKAGEMLEPKVRVTAAEELLDPDLNARLGGAFMGSLMKRFHRYPALCLVAYNASERYAHTLWKRHHRDPFDVFCEEISIRETRGYVKRVLKTYGVYRWLYGGGPPELPIDLALPERN